MLRRNADTDESSFFYEICYDVRMMKLLRCKVEGVETVMAITSAEDKAQRRLEVKARRNLMMGILNEHQLMLNSIKDAKSLLKAIEKRIQKLVSQLELLKEITSQKDVNQKFLRSLPSEWNMHVVVWRNKPDLDSMSMDDLYNNLKSVYTNKITQIETSSRGTKEVQGVSFIADDEEGDTSGALPCQLPPKELNPRSFTLPCSIGIGEDRVKFDMDGVLFMEKGDNGMLKQWMCFRDHEGQSVGGNRMIFIDFLKVRAKATVIEELNDLSSLALDELIDNIKVHEVVMEKDSKIYRGKKKRFNPLP
nr:ribonuclease H-like domain-containing protein [Tanacetum cinerariifolium]